MNSDSAQHGLPDREAVERALANAPSWMTVELVEQTLRVWQPFYEDPLIPEDALEMITDVGRLFDVLSGGREGGGSDETVHRLGAREQP